MYPEVRKRRRARRNIQNVDRLLQKKQDFKEKKANFGAGRQDKYDAEELRAMIQELSSTVFTALRVNSPKTFDSNK